MAITKESMINSIHNRLGFTKTKSAEVVESLFEIMKRTLEKGEDVLISGFGKFCVRDKSERRGRNPATGEEKIIDPRRVVVFKCSGRLKGKISGKK